MGDVEAAGGLSEDGHIVRIAAERLDLPSYPEEGGGLIEEAFVSVCAQDRGVHPAEHAESVVERDHDDVPGRCQLAAIDSRLRPGTNGVAAAVDPDHDRALALVAGGCPDVEVEAVLGLGLGRDADQIADIARNLALHCGGRELGRVADAVPGIHRLGRSPAQFADRRLGEGNAAKDKAAVVLRALEFAERCTDLRWHDHGPLLMIEGGSMVAGELLDTAAHTEDGAVVPIL